MLYDVLPPLFLFGSLGGIIVVVSRVTMRMRKEQFSQHIQQSAATQETKEGPLLTPNVKGLHLFSNRIAVVPHVLKGGVGSTKKWMAERKERKEEKRVARAEEKEAPVVEVKEEVKVTEDTGTGTLQQPRAAWRDKLTSVTSAVSKKVPRRIRVGKPVAGSGVVPPVGAAVKTRSLDLQEDAEQGEKESAGFKLVRVQRKTEEQVVAEERARKQHKTTTSKIQKKARKKEAASVAGPLQQARDAISGKEYDQAEDLLIPYIVQHSKDVGAYMLLGKVALGKEHWEEALEIFEQVISMDESLKGARAGLGHAALKQGKMTLALSSLQRAHDENPEDTQVLQDLLTIAQRMDNKVLERSVREDMAKLEFETIREQAKEPVR